MEKNLSILVTVDNKCMYLDDCLSTEKKKRKKNFAYLNVLTYLLEKKKKKTGKK